MRYLIACAACAASAAALAESAGADMVFTSNRSGGVFELYRMQDDGSGVTPLLPGRDASQIALSPDGRRLAFVSGGGGNADLYVLELAGGQLRRLTDSQGLDGYPSWSPDGKQLVFQSYRDSTPKLYVVSADGSGVRRLTAAQGDESSPAFAPDGKGVAYVVKLGRHEAQLRYAPLDSGAVRVLGREPAKGNEATPQWSPDGRQLAYVVQEGNVSQIHVMHADGSGKRALTQSVGTSSDPQWSPDGKRLLFLSARGAERRQHVYVAAADGSGERQLTEGGSEHLLARWSADGNRIYLVRFESGGGQVYSMDGSGGDLRKLSRQSAYDFEIAAGRPAPALHKTAAR
jgi:TolB protein